MPSASPSQAPQVAVRSPAETMLTDAEVGLPRTASLDHLGYEQAARDEPDEVVALRAFEAAAWADASRRSWSGPSGSLVALVVQSDRAEGAQRLYEYLAEGAARSPLAASDCRATTGLDQCLSGSAAGHAVAAGRLGVDCFRLEGDPASVARALPLLSARLRA